MGICSSDLAVPAGEVAGGIQIRGHSENIHQRRRHGTLVEPRRCRRLPLAGTAIPYSQKNSLVVREVRQVSSSSVKTIDHEAPPILKPFRPFHTFVKSVFR
jgi:hypothetical protein